MIKNGNQQTSNPIFARIKPLVSHSNSIQYLHSIQKSYHIPRPANAQNSVDEKSRNRIEPKDNNKKENKRYDNEEDELENSCYSINQARDSPNMCSTACTKN
jgi:hypothetical protein